MEVKFDEGPAYAARPAAIVQKGKGAAALLASLGLSEGVVGLVLVVVAVVTIGATVYLFNTFTKPITVKSPRPPIQELLSMPHPKR